MTLKEAKEAVKRYQALEEELQQRISYYTADVNRSFNTLNRLNIGNVEDLDNFISTAWKAKKANEEANFKLGLSKRLLADVRSKKQRALATLNEIETRIRNLEFALQKGIKALEELKEKDDNYFKQMHINREARIKSLEGKIKTLENQLQALKD